MTDYIHLQFSQGEQTGQAICAHAAALTNDLNRIRSSVNVLYATGLQGTFLDALTNQLDTLSQSLDRLCVNHDTAGRKLLSTVDQFRQLDAELAAMFAGTPAQRLAASLGIELPVRQDMVFASGQVLGASTTTLDGLDLNPANYPYDYQRRIIDQILQKQQGLDYPDYLRRVLADDQAFLAEIRARLNGNVFTQAVDWVAGVRDDYERIAAETEQRIARWQTMLTDAENRVPELQNEIADLTQKLTAPGNPDVWMQYRSASVDDKNLTRYAGCTAYVASRTYIPEWTNQNGYPGSASQWADNARRWAEQHPEQGIQVNTTPEVGSIAVWKWNHVAQIVQVDPNNPNRVLIAEADTSKDASGQYNQDWGTWTNGRESWIDLSSSTYQNAEYIHLPWSEEQWSGIK